MDKNMILEFQKSIDKKGQPDGLIATGKAQGDFRILALSGLESSDYQLTSFENAQIDGVTITGNRTLPREITADIECSDDARGRVIAFFNPKVLGKLIATVNGRTRWINYKVKALEFNQQNLYDDLTFAIILECPQPYFLDMSDFGKNIAGTVPLYAFPFVWQVGRDFTTDYRAFSTNFLLVNKGDVETGMKVVFIAKDNVKNPQLHLQNGQFIRVIVDMGKGDQIAIETNKGQKSILLNGANAFHKIDRMSTFIALEAGENTLTYLADEGYMDLEVRLYYTPKYLGV